MFNNQDEVNKYISDEGVQYVDVRFCDLPGQMQHFTVPASEFGDSVFTEGLAFDGSSVTGFQTINESDMTLLPDVATARIDPFRAQKTLNMNFFVHDPLTLEAYSRDPRNVARKAENFLSTVDIADTCFFGPEAEFYIFDSVRYESTMHRQFYEVDSVEGVWNTGRDEPGGNKGYKIAAKGGYFPVEPTDQTSDLRAAMGTNLTNAGFELEKLHHEVGTGGQAEINYKFNTLLHAADDLQLFKYIVKNTAWQAGKTVTFMPKPIAGDNGSGMHCHQSLFKGGEPLFYDENGYAGLSDMARHYIGGILHHAPEPGGVHQRDAELVPPPGARLRGPDQPGVLEPQPVGLRPHPDHGQQPEGQAPRVPLSRLVGQPVPVVRRHDDGRPRRHPEQDRAADAGRQGPLRAPARGGRRHRPGPRRSGAGDRQSRVRPRLPARGRRVHLRPHREVGRAQARRHHGPAAAPAPVRVRAVLQLLITSS